MPTNPTQARDETFELFTTEFDPASIVSAFAIRYQGREQEGVPKGFWGRLSMRQVGSGQDAFVMTAEPGASPSSFETFGLVYFQLFAPMAAEDAWRKGDLLATMARDIFRRVETPSGVVFRNARFNELDNDGKYYRWNVVSEYEYTERKG